MFTVKQIKQWIKLFGFEDYLKNGISIMCNGKNEGICINRYQILTFVQIFDFLEKQFQFFFRFPNYSLRFCYFESICCSLITKFGYFHFCTTLSLRQARFGCIYVNFNKAVPIWCSLQSFVYRSFRWVI